MNPVGPPHIPLSAATTPRGCREGMRWQSSPGTPSRDGAAGSRDLLAPTASRSPTHAGTLPAQCLQRDGWKIWLSATA